MQEPPVGEGRPSEPNNDLDGGRALNTGHAHIQANTPLPLSQNSAQENLLLLSAMGNTQYKDVRTQGILVLQVEEI